MSANHNMKAGPYEQAHVWSREVLGVTARVADIGLPIRSLVYMRSGRYSECWEDIAIERYVEVALYAN